MKHSLSRYTRIFSVMKAVKVETTALVSREFLNDGSIPTELNEYPFPVVYRAVTNSLLRASSSWRPGRNEFWSQTDFPGSLSGKSGIPLLFFCDMVLSLLGSPCTEYVPVNNTNDNNN